MPRHFKARYNPRGQSGSRLATAHSSGSVQPLAAQLMQESICALGNHYAPSAKGAAAAITCRRQAARCFAVCVRARKKRLWRISRPALTSQRRVLVAPAASGGDKAGTPPPLSPVLGPGPGAGRFGGAMVSSGLMTPLAIAAWYGSNIGVILLNKYVLSFYHFKYPIFLTLLHMLTCAACANITVASGVMKRQDVKSASHMRRIALLSVVFIGSVVLGNVSLRFLPVSFNQAIGATTPFFTAILSFVVLSQVESRGTYLALIPVVVGIIIASGFEPSFHLVGFIACLAGTCARAMKSVLQSALLSNPDEKLDSMNLLRYMAPVSCMVLLPMTIIMEDTPFYHAIRIASDYPSFYGALILNCLLAFFVNLTNFLVTKYTSALTLQVLGNMKGVVAVFISIALFKNPVSVIALAGYGITICGVVAYSEAKKSAKKAAMEKTKSMDL